jgi:hypothetical protein
MPKLVTPSDNAKVVRFLNANYSDIFSAFEKIATVETV